MPSDEDPEQSADIVFRGKSKIFVQIKVKKIKSQINDNVVGFIMFIMFFNNSNNIISENKKKR